MAINRVALGTRKGLLILERDSDWRVCHEAFAGSHVSIVFLDRRSGNLFACLDDGHFGNKLFRWQGFLSNTNWKSADPKFVWQELTVPKYPVGTKPGKRFDQVCPNPIALISPFDIAWSSKMTSSLSEPPAEVSICRPIVAKIGGNCMETCRPFIVWPSCE